jgi:hypothetical protein
MAKLTSVWECVGRGRGSALRVRRSGSGAIMRAGSPVYAEAMRRFPDAPGPLVPPHSRMMPGRGSKGNLDPSPGPRPGARDIAAAGRGDPAVPPDFAGGGDWRNEVGGAAPFHGRKRCSSGVRDHSARRSGMPRHTRQPHKTAVAEPLLRVPPCLPTGGTRQRRRLRGTFKPRLGLWPRRSQIREPRRANGEVPFRLHDTIQPQNVSADDRTDDSCLRHG